MAGIELTSGRTVYEWMEYSPEKLVEVFVSYSSKRPTASFDLAGNVKEAAFIRFSASTQGSTEHEDPRHGVLELLHPVSPVLSVGGI